jgi:hypothetical protein
MKRFISSISSGDFNLKLLAPGGAAYSYGFDCLQADAGKYGWLLAGMQRLRGRIYVEEGAIPAESLTVDGRHVQLSDEQSWHVLAVDKQESVFGCARYRAHSNSSTFQNLDLRKSALAQSDVWGGTLRKSVTAEMQLAQERGLEYVEVGGWALDLAWRHTAAGLRLALATFGLAQALGGCIGITTATVRNHSATILRKIGGCSLRSGQTEIPSYFDPQYGCEMEMLRFDSDNPNPKYRPWVAEMRDQLRAAPVILAGEKNTQPFTLPSLRPRAAAAAA